MRAPLDAERTRRGALAALGAHGDARARAALERGRIEIEPAVASWEGTTGTVRGHRVTLGVDAGLLAEMRGAPAAHDALHAAVATCVAQRGNEALVELRIRWDARGADPAHPYRGGATTPAERVTLADGLAAFLAAVGERALAVAAARSAITATRARGRVAVTIRCASGDAEAMEQERGRVEDALAALLGEGEETTVLRIEER